MATCHGRRRGSKHLDESGQQRRPDWPRRVLLLNQRCPLIHQRREADIARGLKKGLKQKSKSGNMLEIAFVPRTAKQKGRLLSARFSFSTLRPAEGSRLGWWRKRFPGHFILSVRKKAARGGFPGPAASRSASPMIGRLDISSGRNSRAPVASGSTHQGASARSCGHHRPNGASSTVRKLSRAEPAENP